MPQVKKQNNNINAFLSFLRAGLWERSVRPGFVGEVDFGALFQLAREQSVVGLLAAGLESVEKSRVPQSVRRDFLQQVLMLESKNRQMNDVVKDLMGTFSKAGITACLVKGQGIAQCYERPAWRAMGDVDLMLDYENYEKAKPVLARWAGQAGKEGSGKHFEVHPDPFEIEIHGSFYTGLHPELDARLDVLKEEAFARKAFRPWAVDSQVLLLAPEYDAIYVFSHILHHFFQGGIGLRQLCDWCRLLWTFRSSFDCTALEQRLRYLSLLSEWKVFGAFAVAYLGMPASAMPLYDARHPYRCKTRLLLNYILEVGNFGHNRDVSYYRKYPYLIRKGISLCRKSGDFLRHARLFPRDSLLFLSHFLRKGTRAVAEGR